MFAYLSGTLAHLAEASLVLDVAGVGYQVFVSAATAARLPPKGQPVKIFTYLQVKEDGLALYGFLSQEELDMFLRLITVSGVGPKVALGALGVLNPSQILLAILTGDAALLAKAPGIGRKTAERITLELRDKVRTQDALAGSQADPQQTLALTSSEKQDAIDGLLALGYDRGETVKAVMEVALPEMGAPQILKAALRKLTNR
jgi:Holliday junction DNA helicase RuvA